MMETIAYFLSPAPDVAFPGMALAALSLTIGALFMYFLVIVVVETSVLQFLSWDTFRGCLRASFWMNLASTLVGFFFMGAIPVWGFWGLVIALLLSVVIEGLVLLRLKRQPSSRTWKIAISANLISYALLIFPVYVYMIQQ